MTDTLAQHLGLNPNDPGLRLAIAQVEADRAYLGSLIATRRATRDLADFAAETGVSEQELHDFETDPLDADLGLIRLYACATGVLITHQVLPVVKP